jgi:hypothetical protein
MEEGDGWTHFGVSRPWAPTERGPRRRPSLSSRWQRRGASPADGAHQTPADGGWLALGRLTDGGFCPAAVGGGWTSACELDALSKKNVEGQGNLGKKMRMEGGLAVAWHAGEGGSGRRQGPEHGGCGDAPTSLCREAEQRGGVRCVELHVGRPGEKETTILG